MNLLRLPFIVFITVAVFSQQPPSTSSSPNPGNDPRLRGERIFSDYGCPQCHTIHHRGGTRGPDLSDVGHRLTEEQIRSQILKGGKQMPSFGGILQAREAEDLVAYLHSLHEDEKDTKKQ